MELPKNWNQLRPKPKQREVSILDLAERLIATVGSKRGAHRAIVAAKMRGKQGRPKAASPYLKIDAELLYRIEDRLRELREDGIAASRRTVIAEVVDLSWTGEAGFPLLGRLGASRAAVIARLMSRPSLAALLQEMARPHRSDLDSLDASQPNVATLLRGLWAMNALEKPKPELWLRRTRSGLAWAPSGPVTQKRIQKK